LKILFIGDIVGNIGKTIVKNRLPYYVKKYGIDFVIANGENVSKGKGLTKSDYYDLINLGIDVVTLGNHYSSKKELERYIDNVDNLIRPVNLLKTFPGVGSAVYEVDGVLVRVTNILGSAFINEEVVAPYLSILRVLEEEEPLVNIHIVDFHGEATGEKLSFAYSMDGRVSAVLGTHTHVQTRDYQILPNGTAFISDVGMCGDASGVLGFNKDSVVSKLGLELDRKGRIVVDENGRTSKPNVFAGGDIAENMGTVAYAAKSGRKVAEIIGTEV
jgi:metallophosphoesterase (TIGR00282 family)